MGAAHFPVLMIVLHWLSLGVAINYERMCDTTEHGIKTVKIISHGEPHCFFKLPNDDKILKPSRRSGYYGIRYCFHIDEARQACAKYKAGLLQLRSEDLIEQVKRHYKEITPQVYEYPLQYLLGVKAVQSDYQEGNLTDIPEDIIVLEWDGGVKMTHHLLAQKKFGTKTWIIEYFITNYSISYLFVPCMGSNTSSSPAVYTYPPSRNYVEQVWPLAILCQRIVTHSSECASISSMVGAASLVNIGSTLYCIFRPKEESTALVKVTYESAYCPNRTCTVVNMTAARAICALYSALLPQITSGEMFDAVVNATQQIFHNFYSQSIFLPLGVRIRKLREVNRTYTRRLVTAPQVTQDMERLRESFNVTWDNGMISQLTKVHLKGGDVLFHQPGWHYIWSLFNPAKPSIFLNVSVVCHQEYNAPVTLITEEPPAIKSKPTTTSKGSPSQRSSMNYWSAIINITLAMVVSAFGNISGRFNF